MDIWLKWLHRLTQCSRFFLARNQKYLCPMETGGSERMLLSQFTDELNLVAHPVGDPGFWLEPVVGTSENRTMSGVNPPRQEMNHGWCQSISPVHLRISNAVRPGIVGIYRVWRRPNPGKYDFFIHRDGNTAKKTQKASLQSGRALVHSVEW